MTFYKTSFLFLISGCGALTWFQYRKQQESPDKQALIPPTVSPKVEAEASHFQRQFLVVYCLVMGSDWLQGPYVYSLYKDQFALPERVVGLLFVTGFLSAAISGYFVGQFADANGRKLACLVFCFTYSVACFSTLVPSLPALFFGRVFGGLSTSLMYSAFESWMVTEFHRRKVEHAGTSLSSMYGIMATLNSIVAILSGVFSEWLVQFTETKRSPFMASAALLAVAFWIIALSWTENYGDSHSEESSPSSPTAPAPAPTNILKTIIRDNRILILGLVSCCFEGSMYLFVFFWTPALKAAASQTSSPLTATLPLGLIFASFMTSTTLGSLTFRLLTSYQLLSSPQLLTILTAIASISLLIPALTSSESVTFISFCVFEHCVGMYWPSIGYLKGKYVEDGVRARVYGVLRVPLNIFVVVALGCMGNGEGYRNGVFLFCGGLLVVTSGVFHWTVWEQS